MAISTISNASFGNDSIINANGIKFPAAQVVSADANTLDDYEEGTWTTAWTGLTGTPNTLTGYYTKIGNIVYFMYTVGPTSGTLSGTANTTAFNLPITPASPQRGNAAQITTAVSSGQTCLIYSNVCYTNTFAVSSGDMIFSGSYRA